MNFQSKVILVSFVLLFNIVNETHSVTRIETEGLVHKCCGEYELFVGKSCVHRKQTNETLWHPIFTLEDEQSKSNVSVEFSFRLVTGPPDCGSRQTLTFYQYYNSTEWFRFLFSGVLRHYYTHPMPEWDEDESTVKVIEGIGDVFYHDFEPEKYCADKIVDGQLVGEIARVCAPKQNHSWRQTKFLMRNIISPITHGLSIICFLTIAIIYFKTTNLQDLVGSIIITICMCLIVSQCGDIIRLLTIFNNYISLIITETICYIGLLGSFFWLNSLGYHVWKTFKSTKVSLHIADGKKYCYYSGYAWSCTIILGVLAAFAHITMDYPEVNGFLKLQQREQIGYLGIIIFSIPVAFTVIINVFFFATTLKTINRMQTYERIHYKLRHSFRMFLLLVLTITITWLFFLASITKYEGLINCHIIVNAFQGPLILYVCVFDQKHVAYLIRKTCCHKGSVCACCQSKQSELVSGGEITAMNTESY